MIKSNVASVDDDISAQPEAAQQMLKRPRSIICKTFPAAEELISYQMPTYKLQGEPVLYFGGWKRHYSLYPAKPAPRCQVQVTERQKAKSRVFYK